MSRVMLVVLAVNLALLLIGGACALPASTPSPVGQIKQLEQRIATLEALHPTATPTPPAVIVPKLPPRYILEGFSIWKVDTTVNVAHMSKEQAFVVEGDIRQVEPAWHQDLFWRMVVLRSMIITFCNSEELVIGTFSDMSSASEATFPYTDGWISLTYPPGAGFRVTHFSLPFSDWAYNVNGRVRMIFGGMEFQSFRETAQVCKITVITNKVGNQVSGSDTSGDRYEAEIPRP